MENNNKKIEKSLNTITPIANEQSSSASASIPWIEKYRPQNFEEIVLDKINRKLFDNILKKRYFPNLLFYGPPGTGKTTTIINLIKEYNKIQNNATSPSPSNLIFAENVGNVIHLNASDERGIDIIRNQIYQFVKSKTLFVSTCKFVILDEVDYMTKNAQQALKYLLQTCNENVSFCLICNYISKIEDALKEEFMCIRFNQLPKIEIFNFIKKIVVAENLTVTDDDIVILNELYNSDIRSMINFIQLNQNLDLLKNNILHSSIWETLQNKLYDTENTTNDEIKEYIYSISIKYNTDKKQIIQCFYNYIIRNIINGTVIQQQYHHHQHHQQEDNLFNILIEIEKILHIKEHNIGEHLILAFIISFRKVIRDCVICNI